MVSDFLTPLRHHALMRLRTLTPIVILVFALASAMLAAPIATNAAHISATEVLLDAIEDHGHSHGGEFADAHDAIDHVHDVPTTLSANSLTHPELLQTYLPGMLPILPGVHLRGPDRPPRSIS